MRERGGELRQKFAAPTLPVAGQSWEACPAGCCAPSWAVTPRAQRMLVR